MAGKKKEASQMVQEPTNNNDKNVDLEQSMEALEEVMNQLEQDSLPLEQSFSLYKKGMDLLLACNQAIDKVEKELMILEENGVGDDI